MTLYRIKDNFTDDKGIAHPYYRLYVCLDNGDLIPVKPIYKNDKVKLTASAVDLEGKK